MIPVLYIWIWICEVYEWILAREGGLKLGLALMAVSRSPSQVCGALYPPIYVLAGSEICHVFHAPFGSRESMKFSYCVLCVMKNSGALCTSF